MDYYDSVDFDLFLNDLENDVDVTDDSRSVSSDDVTSSEDFSKGSASPISCMVVAKPKRKRIRVRKALPAQPGPKVIKDDIRRSYSTMIANVLNSGDFSLIFGFLDTFLTPNAVTMFKKSVKGSVCENHEHNISGVISAAQQWFSSLTMAPDAIFSVKDSRVEYHSGKITANMRFSATKLFDDESAMKAMTAMTIEVDSQDDKRRHLGSSSDDGNGAIIKSLIRNVERIMRGLVPKSNPESFSIDGRFVLSTDDEKRITCMELRAEC